MAGVWKSMKVSRLINELSDDDKRAIVAMLAEEGAMSWERNPSPEKDIRLVLGVVSSTGRDAEEFLRYLIGRIPHST